MARDEERHRRVKERKAAKRKEHKRGLARNGILVRPPSTSSHVRTAAQWPLYECWISRDWTKREDLVQIIVARRSSGAEVGVAAFLVDLGCLGVKDALARLCPAQREYVDFLDQIKGTTALVKTDLNLVAKVIDEGIAYARSLGFRPHADYYAAARFLDGAQPEQCSVTVPLGGPDGKPTFIAGPYDNVNRIMNQLSRKVGDGNFHYLIPMGVPDLMLDDDADDEDEED